MKRLQLFFAISCLSVFGPSAYAATVLNDWCVNVTGDQSSCNGSLTSNAAVDLSGFDTTASPGFNNLGTVIVTLSEGSDQNVDFYADYDIDYADYASYNDSATTTDALSSNQSYSIGDPNVYSGSTPTGYTLFDEFANNTLDNTNNEGTPLHGVPQCCDIGLAMGFSDINVDPGGNAVVTFTVSLTAPSSGFYIAQASNDISQPPIYLSAILDTSGSETPEPSTLLLGAGGLALGVFFVRRRRTAYAGLSSF